MDPFRFTSCVEMFEMLGRRARDEQELLDHLEDVPLESVYCHTASRFLRHEVIEPSYPNDFAAWAATEVRDQVLGERLGVLEPFDYRSLVDLRDEIVLILDDHLARMPIVPRIVHGEPFHFMRSVLVEAPSGLEARDVPELARTIARVDASALYYHVIAGRLRRGTAGGDFAVWLESAGRPDLARRVAAISPFSSLEGLRARILDVLRDEAAAIPTPPPAPGEAKEAA